MDIRFDSQEKDFSIYEIEDDLINLTDNDFEPHEVARIKRKRILPLVQRESTPEWNFAMFFIDLLVKESLARDIWKETLNDYVKQANYDNKYIAHYLAEILNIYNLAKNLQYAQGYPRKTE